LLGNPYQTGISGFVKIQEAENQIVVAYEVYDRRIDIRRCFSRPSGRTSRSSASQLG
jgi:hypothetical protein